MAAVEDVSSAEVAAQAAASDVAADEAAGGGGTGRRCSRDYGMTAEFITSAYVAARDGRGGCRINRMRLLDGCVVTSLQAVWEASAAQSRGASSLPSMQQAQL